MTREIYRAASRSSVGGLLSTKATGFGRDLRYGSAPAAFRVLKSIMHPLDEILNAWREETAGSPFSRTRDMGTAFEDLCAAFLTHDPVQAAQFRNVQSFADWARERELRATDAGIDLVAELRDEPGFYAAIQCKFRDTRGSIPKAEIDSFLAESGRPEFRRRVWIDTTGRPWSRNAEETLRHQEKPVQRIGLHYLKASPIHWADYGTMPGRARSSNALLRRSHGCISKTRSTVPSSISGNRARAASS